jgi:hypothetical protein
VNWWEAHREVCEAIEVHTGVPPYDDFDVAGIVGEAYGWSDVVGYFQKATPEEFWQIVDRHERVNL